MVSKPDTPEAERLLGVIAHQNGKLADAVEHVRRAVKLAPKNALFHANLGALAASFILATRVQLPSCRDRTR